MAVEITSVSSGPHTGTGAADQEFVVGFQSAGATQIAVYLDDVLVSPGSYSFARASDGTGIVTATLDGEVMIFSQPNFLQETEFQHQGPYFPDDLNAPLDAAAIRDLYLKARVDIVVNQEMLDAGSRAGKMLGFALGSGAPILVDTTGTSIDALLASLSAGGGAALIGFTSAGGGVMTLADWLAGQPVSVREFGAIGDRVADDTAAIQAAIDAVAVAGGGGVYLPPGSYSTIGLQLLSVFGVVLQGAGRNQTQLVARDSGVTLISVRGTAARCAVKDMWLGVMDTVKGGTYGISILGTNSTSVVSDIEINNVTFQNLSSPLYAKWCHQSHFQKMKFFQTMDTAVSGWCMDLDTVVSCTFRDIIAQTTVGEFGESFCRVSNDCDTVYLENINMAGACGGHGIHFRNPTGASGPRLVRARDCFMEGCDGDGYFIEGDCRDISFLRCEAAVNKGNGYRIGTGAGESIEIAHSLCLQNDKHGILVEGGTGVRILANSISTNSQATDNLYDGVRIEANTTDVTVTDNRIGDFIVASANDQRYGISVAATGTDYITISGNQLDGNQTAPLGNFSTGLNNNIDNRNDTYTGTLTGGTTAPTAEVEFSVKGRLVALRLPALTADGDGETDVTITGGPERMRPKGTRTGLARVVDNGVTVLGTYSVATTGVITLGVGAAGGAFTASVVRGSAACELTPYALD